MAMLIRGNQAIMLGILFFAVAWAYGLMYYWNTNTQAVGLSDKDASLTSTTGQGGILSFIFDTVLEIFSWASPFALFKGIILLISPTNMYTFLNLFMLRPIGWIASYMFIEWAVFTGRGRPE
jgi:hypothetical protein